MPRGPEQRGGRRPLHQAARVHHFDLVGQLDQQRQVVRDEQGGEAELVAQPDQFLENLPLCHHVQRGGRLVHDDDLRFQRQGHRDHRALPHPAGQLVRVAAQPVAGDTDHLQQLDRPLLPRAAVQVRPVCLQHVLDLGTDGDDRVERVQCALHDDRDLRPADPFQVTLVQIQQVGRARHRAGPALAVRPRVEQHLAAGDHAGLAQQPGGRVGQRRLPAAALAGQAEDLAAAQHQIRVHHRVRGLLADPVVNAQAADLQYWFPETGQAGRLTASPGGWGGRAG